MNNKSLSFLSISVLAVSAHLLITEQVYAEIFKCVDANEKVFYNDKPCPVTQIESKIKAVKDPRNGYVPPVFVEEKTGKNAQGVIVGGSSNKKINSSQEAAGAKQHTGNNSTQNSTSSTSSENYGSNPSGDSQDSLKISDSGSISQGANTIEDRMYHERMQRKKGAH